MNYILSIDAGSSSAKIILFDLEGNAVHTVRKIAAVQSAEEQTAVREYDPYAWWESLAEGIAELLVQSRISAQDILAIGLSGQIGTHILVDEHMQPLIDAISWQDGRASKQAEWLKKNIRDVDLDVALGMHLPPGTAWPIPRLLWIKDHYPAFFSGNNKIIQIKEYIAYQLTGKLFTDVLSLRGLVHPRTHLLDPLVSDTILGIPHLQTYLPDFGSADEILGYVNKEAATKTGLFAGTPVITGCGDFHASLLGTGITDSTVAFNITGTSDHVGMLIPATDDAYDVHLGRYPSILPEWDIWYGATSAGGGSFQWFLDSLGKREADESIRSYVEHAVKDLTDPTAILYLPYLNGERAPIWDADARAAFVGMSSNTTHAYILKAVLEGVCYSLKDNFSLMQEQRPTPTLLRVSGAAGGDKVWNQLKADILGVEIVSMSCSESSGLGAAIIAAKGIQAFPSYEKTMEKMVRIKDHYTPDNSKHVLYQQLFSLYRDLYRVLTPIYKDLASIRGMI